MGRREKKTGKGRLDKYYKLAKEQGYRARSAFKLIQLDKKFGFLESARCLIDLCAAPGGWLQVASKYMPPNSLIVGIDLVPIKPIPRCATIADDITSDSCKRSIKAEIKDWKADVVLHDGAPNVGTAWAQDAFSQAELVLASLRLAVDFLAAGGTFVTKIFRSKDYNSLLWVFNQLFKNVEATKPPSSRNVSAEIFVVCSGYLAPKRIDPKLLSNKHVFKDLDLVDPPPPGATALEKLAPNAQNIFQPEKKRRKREGYAEGDYTLFHALPASDFINAPDPIDILGKANRLDFVDDADASLLSTALTTDEVRLLCQDLKVLGKKDFKILLKWRSAVREVMDSDIKQDPAEDLTEHVEIESMDEDVALEQELQRATEADTAKRKREKRKANERKAKEVLKLQLSMGTPMDLGMERNDDDIEHADVFGLRDIDGHQRSDRLDDASDVESEDDGPVIIPRLDSEPDSDLDDDERRLRNLEENLDELYDEYQNRRLERDAKHKVKEERRKRANVDGEWGGIDDGGSQSEDIDSADEDLAASRARSASSASESDASEVRAPPAGARGAKRLRNGRLLTKLDAADRPDLRAHSAATAIWYDQPIFKHMRGIDTATSAPAKSVTSSKKLGALEALPSTSDGELDAPSPSAAHIDVADDQSDVEEKRKLQREDLALVTAEAMTLASQLVNGEKSKSDLIDDGFHRYAFQDKDNVPAWFLDDEMKHFRSNIPVTKEAVDAVRAKMRALNARPIKKIAEAKARKKMHASRRLARMQKKADLVNESADLTEREKAAQIDKLVKKASKDPKAKKREVKLVVAKGTNRGQKGRPGGVKGRYKMVDSRMKKEVRATKRVKRHGASKKYNRQRKK